MTAHAKYRVLLVALLAGCAGVQGGQDGGADAGPPPPDLSMRPRGDGLPTGAVSFFRANACPFGWNARGSAAGRSLVPTIGNAGGGTFAGLPLQSGEDRQHGHSATASTALTSITYLGSGSGNSLAAANQVDLDITVAAASAGLPYVQLLVCQKSAAPLDDAAPVPRGTLMFFATDTCPTGWSQSIATQGRFLVGLPTQGAAGVSFGGPPLNANEQRAHSHGVGGSFTTSAYGVALGSGGTNSFARNATYPFNTTSDGAASDMPYLQLLQCEKD